VTKKKPAGMAMGVDGRMPDEKRDAGRALFGLKFHA
jgi:hypothetical protein